MAEILYNKKHDYALEPDGLFRQFIENNDTPGFILIVPTGKQVKKYKNDFVELYYKQTGKPVVPPDIFTIDGFIEHIYDSTEDLSDRIFISEAFKIELFDQAIRESKSEYFFKNSVINSSTELNRNLVERIAGIIYGLKEDGITFQSMQKDIGDPDVNLTDIKRFKDIAEIYQQYQKLLRNKYLDRAEALNILNNYLTISDKSQFELFESTITKEHVFDKVFKNKDLILFYGFSEFKVPEIEFLNNLSQSSISVIINLDYNASNGPIFGNLLESVSNLKAKDYKSKTIETKNCVYL